VWIENEQAAEVVDLGNACYLLMLRLLALSYVLPSGSPVKKAAVDLAISSMRAMTWVGEAAARCPAGTSNPDCNAGLSFTALRDAAALPASEAAMRFMQERLSELACRAEELAARDWPEAIAGRLRKAAALLHQLSAAAKRRLIWQRSESVVAPPVPSPSTISGAIESAPTELASSGIETAEAAAITLQFETKRCIHARFCVTGAPTVFLANVKGPWLHPETMAVERLVDIAHQCPSGAIRYQRKDGGAPEAAPPVNLVSVRESGPYAVRAEMLIDGASVGYRATLCRCGASKNKPFCDGSHHDARFEATGEPPTAMGWRATEMLPQRDGVLAIDPEPDGPLVVQGNMEVLSGTGRMVCRLTEARLCRCGGSATKPFCDGTHARIGFRSR
jgi:CDGSH-type Zn-finger protein/uncharacterized Fe-S cluster protein YjdI